MNYYLVHVITQKQINSLTKLIEIILMFQYNLHCQNMKTCYSYLTNI